MMRLNNSKKICSKIKLCFLFILSLFTSETVFATNPASKLLVSTELQNNSRIKQDGNKLYIYPVNNSGVIICGSVCFLALGMALIIDGKIERNKLKAKKLENVQKNGGKIDSDYSSKIDLELEKCKKSYWYGGFLTALGIAALLCLLYEKPLVELDEKGVASEWHHLDWQDFSRLVLIKKKASEKQFFRSGAFSYAGSIKEVTQEEVCFWCKSDEIPSIADERRMFFSSRDNYLSPTIAIPVDKLPISKEQFCKIVEAYSKAYQVPC